MGLFETNQAPRVPRAKFDLSHDRKLTMNMGTLIPVLNKEVLPGDVWRCSPTVFLRFLALLAPIMHKVNVKLEVFFCAYRLVWPNFPDFVSGGESGTAAPVFPTFNTTQCNVTNTTILQDGSLLDYLGFPTYPQSGTYNAAYNGNTFSILHPRVYTLIYDTWYRNQNVETTVIGTTFGADGPQNAGDYPFIFSLRSRQWERDYFTSCQPSTQRGTQVVIPISSTITSPSGNTNIPIVRVSGGAANTVSHAIGSKAADGSLMDQTSLAGVYLDPNGSLIASNTSLTVNALRASITLQTYKERMQRGGGRYIEYLWNVFGVASDDARLQRPELIYTLREPVTVSEVLTTSTGTGTGQTPPGTLAGAAMSIGSGGSGVYAAKEHGCIMALMSVIPRSAYQNGIGPEFWRQVNTDFYVPDFAHLGEQTVIQQNVYYDMTNAAQASNGGVVFGYQSRFAEYKYANDQVSGQFKSTLGFWHLGRQFNSTSVPALNLAFCQCVPRKDIFAVTTDVDHIVVDIYWNISVLRPMPYFGTPSTLNAVS
ncbi:major capsid protein VP1 [Microviridae Fen4707_41]|uniref:major capsid protein VP1 n=1 Tax=Microviridae Fen4707_41 TaxID=1655654 RepID=UPI00063D573F|nr:major capsid protein VP1 [Microviridae Fen4707_41]AKI26908.1 major capsid protein VP1 [Microviridae Fen4707_41]